MDDLLRQQIYNNMKLRDTDDLLDIWQTNDRVEWTDIAFDVLETILRERVANLPTQNEPIYGYEDDEDTDDLEYEDGDKFLDDENQPVFYDPEGVLLLADNINWAAKAVVIISIISGFTTSLNLLQMMSNGASPRTLITVGFSILITIFSVVIQIVIYYVALKSLAYILKILMEFEFNSRGVK